jgi:hypothetical protein
MPTFTGICEEILVFAAAASNPGKSIMENRSPGTGILLFLYGVSGICSLEYRIKHKEFPDLSGNGVKPYIKDFMRTLSMGSIFEQKSFIRSLIKRIWIDYTTATIEYTMPINDSLENQHAHHLLLPRL